MKAETDKLRQIAEAATPTIHHLKTWPEPFEAIWTGLKDWELRKDDRGFQVGDILHLVETAEGGVLPIPDRPSRSLYMEVIWMLRGPAFGLPEGYVIMSLKDRHARATQAEADLAAARAREGRLTDELIGDVIGKFMPSDWLWSPTDVGRALRAVLQGEVKAPVAWSKLCNVAELQPSLHFNRAKASLTLSFATAEQAWDAYSAFATAVGTPPPAKGEC